MVIFGFSFFFFCLVLVEKWHKDQTFQLTFETVLAMIDKYMILNRWTQTSGKIFLFLISEQFIHVHVTLTKTI